MGLLAFGLSRPLLLWVGRRAPGFIVFQERGVSTRGAYKVRYHFITADGRDCTGTAFTALREARLVRVSIAYCPLVPQVNMPAYGGYAAITGLGWGLAGLVAWLASRAIRGPRSGRRAQGGENT
jgi:hypothetical protein